MKSTFKLATALSIVTLSLSAMVASPATATDSATVSTATPITVGASDAGSPLTGDPNDVSCSSVGNCVLVGLYENNQGYQEAGVATEISGTWGPMTSISLPVSAISTFRSALYSVSCPSDGNCTAIGRFYNSDERWAALLVSEVNGTWQQAVTLTLPSGVEADSSYSNEYLNAVSCSSAGNCVAVGDFRDSNNQYEALTVSQVGGTWQVGHPATFASGVDASDPSDYFNDVACPSDGNCVVVGTYDGADGLQHSAIEVETNGTWGDTFEPAFSAGQIYSGDGSELTWVSCVSTGNCTVAGDAANASMLDTAYTVTMEAGQWQTPVFATFASGVQGSAPVSQFSSISCTSVGNCVATGQGHNYDNYYEAVTAQEIGGTWQQAQLVTLPSNLISSSYQSSNINDVACTSDGNCLATGVFSDLNGFQESMTVAEVDGTWQTAVPTSFTSGVQSSSPSDSGSAVACLSSGDCMVTGYYLDTNSNENTFVEAATLPAAQVTPMSASSTLSVHFTLDSWTLTSADKTALRNYAAGLSAHGHGMALVVTGYVEPTPVNKDKVFLSTMRAKAVVKFLKSIGVTASFRTVAGGNGSAHNASSRKATISQA